MQLYEQNFGEKLFVGNLPPDASEQELWGLFSMFGPVMEVVVLGASRSRSGQSCAFVKLGDHNSAVNAINHLDGRVSLRPHSDTSLLLQVRPAKSTPPAHASGGASSRLGMPPVGSTDESGGYSTRSTHDMHHQALLGESVRLFVGNIPLGVVAVEINDLFHSVGVSLLDTETFIMNGNKNSHNSICAFVVAATPGDAKKAIELLSNKVSMRPGSQHIKVKLANPSNTSSQGPPNGGKYDNVFAPVSSSVNNNYQKYYMPLYPDSSNSEYIDWKEPSIKTYHQYMMMPQSSHYGPLNIIPGSEPWRNNGIYSLPSASHISYFGH
jgi:RNA recognition motif-containing protein